MSRKKKIKCAPFVAFCVLVACLFAASIEPCPLATGSECVHSNLQVNWHWISHWHMRYCQNPKKFFINQTIRLWYLTKYNIRCCLNTKHLSGNPAALIIIYARGRERGMGGSCKSKSPSCLLSPAEERGAPIWRPRPTCHAVQYANARVTKGNWWLVTWTKLSHWQSVSDLRNSRTISSPTAICPFKRNEKMSQKRTNERIFLTQKGHFLL